MPRAQPVTPHQSPFLFSLPLCFMLCTVINFMHESLHWIRIIKLIAGEIVGDMKSLFHILFSLICVEKSHCERTQIANAGLGFQRGYAVTGEIRGLQSGSKIIRCSLSLSLIHHRCLLTPMLLQPFPSKPNSGIPRNRKSPTEKHIMVTLEVSNAKLPRSFESSATGDERERENVKI